MNNDLKKSLIITSISAPNSAMKQYAKKCKEHSIEFIVIGDVSSPKDFALEDCTFLGIEEQERLPFKLASMLPKKHYARKNIGYLLSKHKDIIIETDDDNDPKESFWNKSYEEKPSRVISEKGWINIYKFFSDEQIWPRGFPLHMIHNPKPSHLLSSHEPVMIMQGLADGDPDVDAIYRMTNKTITEFRTDSPVVLNEGVWCPFNSQNTLWKKESFPLLYLPSYCSFRMTDIWRSFIAQRIAWTCGWKILFHEADVVQVRNEHNLHKDFLDEIQGYTHNDEIRICLDNLKLKSGKENIIENLIICYEHMIENCWIGKEEMPLVMAWCSEF